MSRLGDEAPPTIVTVVFPGALAPTLADAIRAHATAEGVPVEVRTVDWDLGTGRQPPPDDIERSALAEADVVVGIGLRVAAGQLSPRIRFVQSTSAGVGPIVRDLKGTSIRLASSAGLSGDKVAEFAMARLLTVWSDARTLDALQRARRWAHAEVDTTPIGGRTVLVVGAGGIGQAFARRASAFDLRCVGVRRRPELGAPSGFERVVAPEAFLSELPAVDAVVLAVPATHKTAGLVGREELDAMRPGAVLCNVARGSLVDEEALADALIRGHLGAAVLDVTATEPLSRRSPLWRLPNAYLSPHVA
ncbi:MAG TPA: NAD(P)-dependent oxidoreductase, partial [Acidimicrobiales bacterium]|nr:NAD(P)-dependent oxidoreductase [Acidimicrobiales bacterium]